MELLKIPTENQTPLKDILLQEPSWKADLNYCMTCGTCSAGCPIAGYDGYDPRMLVRMILMGLEEEMWKLDWIYMCTGCERCTYACPQGINIGNMITRARSMRNRNQVPGGSQKTCDNHRDRGNNMDINEEDWIDTCEWMLEELQENYPEAECPFDKTNAEYYATINSKLPQFHPLDLQEIMGIFKAAGVEWTMPKIWWEGTNYCMFSGDLDSWEHNLRKQVDNQEKLGIPIMAYTECGHGYFATLAGYDKFGIKPNFKVVHVVNLYAQWIQEGRFKLDKSRNPQRVTLHDPCNVGRKSLLNGYQDILDDARFVIENVCEDFVEMHPNRENNYCCSGGGGALTSGFYKARMHYGRVKVEQIDRTGAELVCTPCVNCFDGIDELRVKKAYDRPWKPIHLWTLLWNAIVLDDNKEEN